MLEPDLNALPALVTPIGAGASADGSAVRGSAAAPPQAASDIAAPPQAAVNLAASATFVLCIVAIRHWSIGLLDTEPRCHFGTIA